MKRSLAKAGHSCQYFRLCSANPLNPDIWSYRKGAKTAGKLEDYRERAKKIGQRQKPASRSSYIPMVGRVTFRSRGLEDDEELLRRDLDSEEVFGREYDLFDERDTFDDLD